MTGWWRRWHRQRATTAQSKSMLRCSYEWLAHLFFWTMIWQTCTHTHTHTRIKHTLKTYTHARILTHSRTHTRNTHNVTHTHIHIHTCTHIHMHTCTHKCMYTYAHTHMHTHAHPCAGWPASRWQPNQVQAPSARVKASPSMTAAPLAARLLVPWCPLTQPKVIVSRSRGRHCRQSSSSSRGIIDRARTCSATAGSKPQDAAASFGEHPQGPCCCFRPRHVEFVRMQRARCV